MTLPAIVSTASNPAAVTATDPRAHIRLLWGGLDLAEPVVSAGALVPGGPGAPHMAVITQAGLWT